ncbi:G-protein alpha subunit-domain-containing protein [Coprinopsis sp. MPI-PUGE-AT-0042]|nr:G-protein alpha subunit-domain-containing protein [Coprinopsis sp. MPI-PUGE-AT-0042]
MAKEDNARNEKTVLTPESQPPISYPKDLTPAGSRHYHGHPSASDLPNPYEGLDSITNSTPHDGILPPAQPLPWLPNQSIEPTTTSAPTHASTAELFQGGSHNALNNSTANVANRDVLHVGNTHLHLSHPSHAEQGPSTPLQILQNPVFNLTFPYVLSTATPLAAQTAVTLSPQDGAPNALMLPSPSATPSLAMPQLPEPTVLGSESDTGQATNAAPFQMGENTETERGSFEITLLDDLDMDVRHQPKAWYRSPDLPNGLSLDGIYIRKIYPNGHGYPCPNPSPEGPPVRIGDIGELTSTGFIALANLADCQIPSLQSELASLALSDPSHKPNYFSEGQSITGGVSVDKIKRWRLFNIIRNIKYRCHAPQGAILAVTSPAQLHTLPQDRNHRLRAWLGKHGMELVQFVDPGRTDPLYIVTGKITSSSWANATYSEPMIAPDDVLVLSRRFHGIPPYLWTEPKSARNWSQSSSTVNAQGERASDQCLFLRGFLLTPSPRYWSRQTRRALKTSNGNPDISESRPDVDAKGGASEEGSSQFTPSSQPSSRSGAPREVTMGGRAAASERDDLLIEEVPALTSLDFYPSHRINRRLLELTDADMAITHDDDWRLRLEKLHHPSLSGVREDIPASVSGSAGLNAGDVEPVTHQQQGHPTSTMGKQEGQTGLIQSFPEGKRTGSTNVISRDDARYYDTEHAEANEEVRQPPMLWTDPWEGATTKSELEAKRISDQIDNDLREERERMWKKKDDVKLLLLGQAESGKSTLRKQFQIMYNPSSLERERASWVTVIYFTIVHSLKHILTTLEAWNDSLEGTDFDETPTGRWRSRSSGSAVGSSSSVATTSEAPDANGPVQIAKLRLRLSLLIAADEQLADRLTGGVSVSGSGKGVVHVRSDWQVRATGGTIGKFEQRGIETGNRRQGGPSQEPHDPLIQKVGLMLELCEQDIEELWSHPTVKGLIAKEKLKLDEWSDHFLRQIKRIATPDYIPTTDDILHSRVQTLGVAEHCFDMKSDDRNVTWHLYDVGGARGRRHTWIPYFDDANAIIFIAPVSALDQFLDEDPRINRVDDSLQLFTQICSNALLNDVHLILFLNKIDLLKAKLTKGLQVKY